MMQTNQYQAIVRDFGTSERAMELIEGSLLASRRAWEAGQTSQGYYDSQCRQATAALVSAS